MSDRIDQRIVEMSFENHKFEKGIKQSKGSLKEFANALEKSGTGKGFEGLEKSVNSVSSSFSMLEQIGVGALRRIGEMAVDAGTKMLKHLAVDPLSMGWDKYEQKTASVQTIMNATGLSIQEVNEHLDKLMWFSDETSYGFTDMTAALAQMTSSGGDVKKLIPLITGVANATAYAGKGAVEFQRSMYNINQSYGSGSLQFMDWKSLELAGVAGKDLKQIFIDTGIALGKLDKNGKTAKGTLVDIGNFGTTLSEKWADTSVMEAAFGKFSELSEAAYELVKDGTYETAAEAMEALSGQYSELAEKAFESAQQAKSFREAIAATLDAVSTGWMKTYELIFGELDEATRNFSALTEVLWTIFASGAAARNEMIKLIKDGGGIKNLFQSIKNVAIALLTPLRAVSRAFDQFFPPKTADQWLSMISIMENFTRGLIITEETAEKIQRTFAGFFAVLDIGWETVKFLGSALYEIINIFVPLNGNLLEMTASVGDFLVMLNHLIKQSGVFQYGLLGVKIAAIIIRDTLTNIVGKISEFVHALWTTDKPLELIGQTVQNLFSGVLNTLKTIITWVSGKFKNALSSVFNFLSKGLKLDDGGVLGGLLKTLREFIEFIITEATGGLLDFGGALDKLDFSRIATFVSGGVLLLFVNQLSNLTKSMSGLINTTNSFVTKFSKKLFGTTTKIKDLAYVFGILSASLYVLSRIPWDEMKVGLKGLAISMGMFVLAYGGIQAITVASSKALNGIEVVKSTLSLTALSAGMIGLAIALQQISKISEYDVWRSVGVLTTLMVVVTAYQALSALISTIPGQRALLTNFNGMTYGLLALVGTILILNLVKPETIQGGMNKLYSILGVLASIQIAFAVAAKVSGGNKLSTSLFGISAGVLAMVGVIKILSILNISEMSKGIKNVFLIGGVLAGIQLLFSMAGRIGGGIRFKANIFSMQMGLISMVALLAIMDKIGQKKLQNGIGTLTKMAGIIAGLEILTAVAARIGGGHKLQKILGSVTLTMLSFTALIGIINFMTPETIDKGLATIKKMLGIILGFQALVSLTGVLSRGASSNSFAILTGMVAGVLTTTAALILLSMQDQTALSNAAKNLAMTVAAVGVMSTGIGIMMKTLSELSTGLGGLRAIASKLLPGFAAMGVILIATLALIQLINVSNVDNISWSGFGKFALGLGTLTTLVTAFTALSKLPGLSGGAAGLIALIPGFAGMTAVVVATAGLFVVMGSVLDTVDSISMVSFGKFVTGIALIGIMALGVSLLSMPLAAMGPKILPILGGVLSAVAGVGTIVLAFAGLAALMEAFFGSNSQFLTDGIDKLVQMGEGIGRFVGAIASGFKKELIIGYGEGLAGFAAAMGEIDPASFDGVESLAKALLILTATSILDGLSKFVNFGKNPGKVFGAQIKGLIKSLSGITEDDATKTSNILTALRPMTENLIPLIEAVQAIPNSGGLSGALMGNNDIDDFGKQIGKFIKSFNKIDLFQANHTSNILVALGPMISSFKLFIEASANIPNSGGTLGYWIGNNDIDDFGKHIGKFIKSFDKIDISQANHTSNIIQALGPMVGSFKGFVETASTIPNSGGMVSWFAGDNSIDDFAKGVSKMVKEFKKIDTTQIQSASDNIQLMANDMLPSLHKFVSLTTRLSDIGGPWDQSLPLLNFATTLKEFVKILSGVDVSVVGPALKSLEDITTSFKVIGAEVLESAKQSFDNNKQPFQTSIVTFLDGIIKEVNGRKPDITRSFETIFTEALKKSKSYITEFRTLGSDIIKGLKEGINRESPSAESAIGKVVNAVTMKTRHGFQVESPSKVFSEIGGWLSKGLGHGIERNANVAILAAVNMGGAVEEGIRDSLDIHSFGDIFPGIGKNVTGGLGYGMESVKSKLLKTANDLGLDTTKMSIKGMTEGLAEGEGAVTKGVTSLIELLTGDKAISDVAESSGVKTGGVFGDGVAKGIGSSGSKKKVAKSATQLADEAFAAFKKQMDYLTEYDLITPEEEISKWEEFWAAQVEGSENWLKGEKKVNELKFQYSKNWIDREKYYKRLSLEEELAAWGRVQAKYKEGHAYRLQAEREIFRVKQEISQLDYQNALDFIEESKYYGRMNLTQELREWKKIINITQEASDERKRANREVYRLENEIREANLAYEEKLKKIESDRNDRRIQAEEEYYGKVKDVNDRLERDIKALTDAYENAVESRAKTLYSTWGLFDKVDPFQPIDGNELFKNLEDQVVAFDQWQAQIGVLSAKGVDEGLVKELRDMGPKSLPQILALNKMTDTQLNGYVSLWQKKSREAKDQAVYELQDMRVETYRQIADLTKEADIELDRYETVWNDTLKQINKDSEKQLTELEKEWTGSIGSMTSSGMNLIKQFRKDWFGEIAETIKETKSQVVELQRITSDLAPMTNAATIAVATALNDLDTVPSGKNFVAGFAKGVSSNTKVATKATTNLGRSAVRDLNQTLMIHSPSKKTMEIGKYFVEGLAWGIRRYSGSLYTESANVGMMALEAVSLSMNSVSDLIDNDVDAFTITPVLDLTNVRSGMHDINSLFDNTSILGLGSSVDLLPPANAPNQNGILDAIKDGLLSVANPEVDLTGTLTVQVVNDKGEIVDIAETAIKDILRRESR